MDALQIISKRNIEIHTCLGSGSFGTVYQAKYHERKVIAKQFLTEQLKPRIKEKLLNEARTLYRVSHPNTVKLLALIMEDDFCGLVLEYMECGPLDEFLEDYSVPLFMKLEMIEGIVRGMHHLHSQSPPIIHRELKSPNVLVSHDLQLKISDFGLPTWRSYFQSRGQCGGRSTDTVTHIPPESWHDLNTPPSKAFDVYAFGILLWIICTERLPFVGVALAQIKECVKEGQRPPMSEVPDTTPNLIKKILQKSWDQSPQLRPSFESIKAELDQATDINMLRRTADADRVALIRDIQGRTSQEVVVDGVEEVDTGVKQSWTSSTSTGPTENAPERQHHVQHDPGTFLGQEPPSVVSLHLDTSINPQVDETARLVESLHVNTYLEPEIDGALNLPSQDHDVTRKTASQKTASHLVGPGPSMSVAYTDVNTDTCTTPAFNSSLSTDCVVPDAATGPCNRMVPPGQSSLPKEAEPDAEPESYFSARTPPEAPPTTTEHLTGGIPSGRSQPPPYTATGNQSTEEFLRNIIPNVNINIPDFSKKQPFIVHQRGDIGHTIVYASENEKGHNNIQIGDRNVMHISRGTGRQKTGVQPNRPAPLTVIKEKISKSNEMIDQKNMELISKHLGRYWRALGRKLGFSSGELDTINADYHIEGREETIHQMLELWRVREGKKATLALVADRLLSIDRSDLAVMLK